MTKIVFFSLFVNFSSFFDTNPTRNRPKIAQIRDFLPDPGISLRIWQILGFLGKSRDFPEIVYRAAKRTFPDAFPFGVVLSRFPCLMWLQSESEVADSFQMSRMWELSCDYRTQIMSLQHLMTSLRSRHLGAEIAKIDQLLLV